MEKHFSLKILSFYTDGGGEFQSLSSYLSSNGIEHLITPPYTPQRVALAERRHRHIIETTRTLLYQASLTSNLWTFACHHAMYLINYLPTPTLNNHSPYEMLFDAKPDYKSLKVFSCLRYPWLKLYSPNKLQPRSTPCVYLGFSLTHHCHQCFDPIKSKIYLSRDVIFVKNEFPFKTMFTNIFDSFKQLVWDDLCQISPPPAQQPPPTSTNPISDLPNLIPVRNPISDTDLVTCSTSSHSCRTYTKLSSFRSFSNCYIRTHSFYFPRPTTTMHHYPFSK